MNIETINLCYKFKDEYIVAYILWLLKRATTQAVILDFLPENKHGTWSQKSWEKEEWRKWICFLNKFVCGLKIMSMQAFRGKMFEIYVEKDKYKAYDARYIKKLLKNRYRDFIMFSENVGKESPMYFKNMAEYIIKESEKRKKKNLQKIPFISLIWIVLNSSLVRIFC